MKMINYSICYAQRTLCAMVSTYSPCRPKRKLRMGDSDWLAKLLSVIQTSWFVMQCIGWSVEHLPVTHLEIVTLAYVATSFVIFIFWWNKPLNIHRPVRVFRKLELGATDNGIEAHDSGESEPREMQLQVREPISEQQKLTWKAIRNVLQMLLTFIIGAQDGGIILSRKDRVPRFGADNKHSPLIS